MYLTGKTLKFFKYFLITHLTENNSKEGGCTGAGGPRGATPLSGTGGAAMRRCPLSKVRSSGCALLE